MTTPTTGSKAAVGSLGGRALGSIRAIICDVDGTLTDGGLWIDDLGREAKRFDVHDGLGIALWRKAGAHFGVVTGRRGLALSHRLAELGVESVVQGAGDKAACVRSLCVGWGIEPGACAFVGDDLPDMPAMRACGVGVAVATARPEVVACAHAVTLSRPGSGAIREVVEAILVAQGKWADVTASYGSAAGTSS